MYNHANHLALPDVANSATIIATKKTSPVLHLSPETNRLTIHRRLRQLAASPCRATVKFQTASKLAPAAIAMADARGAVAWRRAAGVRGARECNGRAQTSKPLQNRQTFPETKCLAP